MSNTFKLHIVSFDVPFPPNYGGVIDVYYKCKHLHQLGIEIELHCFEYGRAKAIELERYCSKVHYYRRKRYINPFISSVPYIVKSRIHKQLIANLAKDNHPILLEGLHTSYPLVDERIDNSRCFVRTHNIEHEYYKRLESVERSIFKRRFFRIESAKLAAYEIILKDAAGVLAISQFDQAHFAKINPNTIAASAFHESEVVDVLPGKGDYVLYHGNLGVGENNHAAEYLVNEVFSNVNAKCIIAGNNASEHLRKLCAENDVQLSENISSKEIIGLIQNAQVNVLPTFQKTGIKLKLLNALFKGRHCLVNSPMVEDTGLEGLCYIADNAENMIHQINELMEIELLTNEIERRVASLTPFENRTNALIVKAAIFQ
mgnify:CR=1 FL=1|jgi:hypothetical protein